MSLFQYKISLEQIQAFLETSAENEFGAENRQELYDWMSRTLDARLRKASPSLPAACKPQNGNCSPLFIRGKQRD